MWLFVAVVCVSAEVCFTEWSDKALFRTHEECLAGATIKLDSGMDYFSSQGEEIFYLNSQCVYFDHILPEGEPT